VFDIASIAVSVLLGQAPWQKAGLQPGMLGGDPEMVCLRQVGGLQGRKIECAMRGMFAAGASAVETSKGEWICMFMNGIRVDYSLDTRHMYSVQGGQPMP
jgi:hypothetical protein